jgi:hypothetical protein
MKKTYLSPPYHLLSLLQLSTFQIFPYGFTQIDLDRDLDKTGRKKEGLVSPMTPGVGKIPWHLSLYGSEVKLLLLLLCTVHYLFCKYCTVYYSGPLLST